jgi:hypothetical protein
VPGLLIAQFLPDQGGGPEPTGDFKVSPDAFLALLMVGFLVGIFGHIIKSKTTVAVGVGMVFLATVGVPLGYALSN